MSRAQRLDAYIGGFPEPARTLLVQLRALATDAVSEAREAIKWG